MHVVILGCGRVGVLLARSLEASGHTVAVIDQDAAGFERLGAGVHRADASPASASTATPSPRRASSGPSAFAAVSSGDNTNIIAARVARETFGVERVVARIYDPRRAEVYERLGIPTVRTVRWTADQVLRRIDPPERGRRVDRPERHGRARPGRLHRGWVGAQAQEPRGGGRRPRRATSPDGATGCCPSAAPWCRTATSCTCCCTATSASGRGRRCAPRRRPRHERTAC